MAEIGRYNELAIARIIDRGMYLEGGNLGEIWYPKSQTPGDEGAAPAVGDSIRVFVYCDSDDRPIATSQKPHAQVGEYAFLRVNSLQPVGAFLEWGLEKELLLPFREQTREIDEGDRVIVFIYIDSSGRISSSMRTEKHLDKTPGDYPEGHRVDLLVYGKTDLGFKAIVEGRHSGILYSNEVFQALEYGERITGFIKKVRPDGKLDLTLAQPGHKASGEVEQKILALLNWKQGFLPIDDKTSPEEIYNLVGVSKKKYKMALGGLLKKRLIRFEKDGIATISDNRQTV